MITYSVDAEDTLVDVGGDWESFALKNNGAHLTRENVVGKSLFAFIDSADIEVIYRSLFEKVRKTQRPISFTFRCDSPCFQRRMMLRIESRPDLGLDFTTELIDENAWDTIPLLDSEVPRSDELIRICCICSDVESDGGLWVPIEQESTRRNLLVHNAVPQLSHGYCPNCLMEQLQLLDSPA